MTTRTRRFMLGSAAVIVVGLCTGLYAYYGGLPLVSGQTAGPQEMTYVPADALAVGYADVREVMQSDLRKRLREIHPDGKGQQEFQDKTGINLETDVDYILGFALGADKGHPIV